MKVLIALVILLVFTLVISTRRPKKLSLPLQRSIREITSSRGTAANGAYIQEDIYFPAVEKFTYRTFISDGGLLTLQVDFATIAATATLGPIALLNGDLTTGNNGTPGTSAPTVAGSGYANGTFPAISLIAITGTGSGALARIVVEGGAVKTVNLISGGVGYQVGDTVKPCFLDIQAQAPSQGATQFTSSGTCSTQGGGCVITVAAIVKRSTQNQDVLLPAWSSLTTVSEMGATAAYAANETRASAITTSNPSGFINYVGNSYAGYYPGICNEPPVSNNAQNQWFCAMDEISVAKDGNSRTIMRFNNFYIIARTSEKDPTDMNVYYLIYSYEGFGILATPRGSQITIDLFTIGYTSLFSDMGHPRCGQISLGPNLPTQSRTFFTNYTCGESCCNVMPPTDANAYAVLIWEMASPSGAYRLQFFDSGHVRFIKYTPSVIRTLRLKEGGQNYVNGTAVSLVARTTSYTVPVNVNGQQQLDTRFFPNGSGATASITVNNRGNITNIALVNGGTGFGIGSTLTLGTGGAVFVVEDVEQDPGPELFTTIKRGNTDYTFPQCVISENPVTLVPLKKTEIRRDSWTVRGSSFLLDRDGIYTTIPCIDMMIQITDSGALIMQKDYQYNAGNSLSHVMTQGSVGLFNAADPMLATNGQSIVGLPSSNDTNENNLHAKLGQALTCYGNALDQTRNFEIASGTIIATTGLFPNNAVYNLWMGPWGLRLLNSNPTSTILQNPLECIWITPFYYQWYYTGANPLGGLRSNFSICRSGSGPYYPLPESAVPTLLGNGAVVPNNRINYCGTFVKPTQATPDDSPERSILDLRSKNKRFLFRMMNSGRCFLLDMSAPTVPLWSTDMYNSPERCT